MKRNVFITGIAGFIGFHLARYLVQMGDHVVGLDVFNDYYSVELKRQRAEILEKEGIQVIHGDVCNEDELRRAVELHKTTHMVHLAAQAGVRYSINNPHAYIRANIDGFISVLEVVRTLKDIKLVYASSSSVYGLNTKVPFAEEDQTDQQASVYGVSKKSNELLAYTYHHLYQIPVVGLRFFTVYGPWGRPDMAYFLFTKAILEGRPVSLYNNGKMKRDFTYIDDIVEGIAAALDCGRTCDIFNLGNNKPVELGKFIDILEFALEKKAKREYLPMQPGDVEITYAEISLSRQILGFNPKNPLEAGIPKFVEWYLCWCKN